MSKQTNTKKITLVNRVTDGKTYGTVNSSLADGNFYDVSFGIDDSVHSLRAGFLLPKADNTKARIIAQSYLIDNGKYSDGFRCTKPEGVTREDGIDLADVHLAHAYDLKPTHELDGFYRVKLKNSPVSKIRVKKPTDPYLANLEEPSDKIMVSDVDASPLNYGDFLLFVDVDVHEVSLEGTWILNEGLDDERVSENTTSYNDGFEMALEKEYPNSFYQFDISLQKNNLDVTKVSRLYFPSRSGDIPLSHLVNAKTLSVKNGDTYVIEKAPFKLVCRDRGSQQVLGFYICQDTDVFDIYFPYAGEESYVWTRNISPLNDVSSAPKVKDVMPSLVGIYDVIMYSADLFHNTNTNIGQIHTLNIGQTLQITEDCRCIIEDDTLQWCEVVYASMTLWIRGSDFRERLEKSSSYVDRLAIFMDSSLPEETLEKVVVVSEVKSQGVVVGYKYIPFDAEQEQRTKRDEYSFTSYAVERGGEEIAHGKIVVLSRTPQVQVKVIENSIDGWVNDTFHITAEDAERIDKGEVCRINLYTDSECTQKVENGDGGFLWIAITDKEIGLLDGEDITSSENVATQQELAFMAPVPVNMDGLISNDGQVSLDPVSISEYYETYDGQRKFVVIDGNIYEVVSIEMLENQQP